MLLIFEIYTVLFIHCIIAKSFIELVKYLFSVPGVNSFLSRRLCQDPLEKFFGCQRQIGRTHDNPTVKEFAQNTQTLRVVSSFCRSSVKSNCRGNKDLITTEHINYSLPKRRKRKENDIELEPVLTTTELGKQKLTLFVLTNITIIFFRFRCSM